LEVLLFRNHIKGQLLGEKVKHLKARVKLESVIEELQMMFDDQRSFFNIKTGEIALISNEELKFAEEEKLIEDYPGWQQENINIAIEIILEEDIWIPLPSKYDVNEYEIMERFCLSIENNKIRDYLYYSIKGRGAFQKFKDNIERYDIEQDWNRFKDNALKEIAIDWCRENEIIYE
jgi:hypothetical protein